MAERFDVLFEGLSEESSLKILLSDPRDLPNPVDKYMAATRLAACSSEESLQGLISAVDLDPEDLFNRITRRKAIEALGRRKDVQALDCLFKALEFDDEPSVINAADSITQISAPLTESQCDSLLKALKGSDPQRRSVIQAHTRLGLQSGTPFIQTLIHDENPLISGAARAFCARVEGDLDQLKPLIPQLNDLQAGRRRSAVIDLGDAGDVTMLDYLIKSAVSMPLRAKSAFQLVDPGKKAEVPEEHISTITSLLQDDPRSLSLRDEWLSNQDPIEIENNLQHRDEGKQYGAALSLLKMTRPQQIEIIDGIRSRLWSDYGANYLLTSLIGLGSIGEREELIKTSLAETLPQYAKSRVAAAWGCLRLDLKDQLGLLKSISTSSKWVPLKWSCSQVLKQFS
jgi:hypothetical protein